MLKLLGVSAEKAEQLLHILRRWDDHIISEQDRDDLYNITIDNTVPFLVQYNHPFFRFNLGVDTIEINIDEVVQIRII